MLSVSLSFLLGSLYCKFLLVLYLYVICFNISVSHFAASFFQERSIKGRQKVFTIFFNQRYQFQNKYNFKVMRIILVVLISFYLICFTFINQEMGNCADQPLSRCQHQRNQIINMIHMRQLHEKFLYHITCAHDHVTSQNNCHKSMQCCHWMLLFVYC